MPCVVVIGYFVRNIVLICSKTRAALRKPGVMVLCRRLEQPLGWIYMYCMRNVNVAPITKLFHFDFGLHKSIEFTRLHPFTISFSLFFTFSFSVLLRLGKGDDSRNINAPRTNREATLPPIASIFPPISKWCVWLELCFKFVFLYNNSCITIVLLYLIGE